MKILMFAPGQSEHSTRPLKMLLESGCEVTFMDFIDPLPQGHENYQFIPYPSPRGKRWTQHLGKNLAARLADWSIGLQLRQVWKRVKPDVTHMHWISPQRAEQCLNAGMHPFALSAWGSDINNHFKPDANPLEKKRVGQALAQVNIVIIDSVDIAAKCAELAGKPVRTVNLPLGVDTTRFKPGYEDESRAWRKKLGIPENALVLLSIRAWSPFYGHQHLLESFAQAFLHFEVPAILLFKTLNKSTYPEAESFERQIRSRVEALGLSDHVRWLEQVPFERLHEIYAASDVILNYPEMDAFPVTFQEAAACERPVISACLPAYAATFAEKYFTFVEPGNMTQLTDAMMRFVNAGEEEKARRKKLLSQARREVEQTHDERAYARGLLKIYEELKQR